MKKIIRFCLILMMLFWITSSVTAEDAGSITLEFNHYNELVKTAHQPEQPVDFTAMNIRVVQLEDGIETISRRDQGEVPSGSFHYGPRIL